MATAGDLDQIEGAEALVQAELVAAGAEHHVFLRGRGLHPHGADGPDPGVDGGRGDGRAALGVRTHDAVAVHAGHGVVAGGKDAVFALKLRQNDAQLVLHAGVQRNAVLGKRHAGRRAVHAHRRLRGLGGQIVGIDVDRRLSLGHARHGAVRRHRRNGGIAALEGAAAAVAGAGELRRDRRGLAHEDLRAGGRRADTLGGGLHRHLAAHAAVCGGRRDGRAALAHAVEPAGIRVNGHIFRCSGGKFHRAGRSVSVGRPAVAELHAQGHALVAHADGGTALAEADRHRLGIFAVDDPQRVIVVVCKAAHAVHAPAGILILVDLAALDRVHRARSSGVDPSGLDVLLGVRVERHLQAIRLIGILGGAGNHIDHSLTEPCNDLVGGGISRKNLGVLLQNLRKSLHKRGAFGGLFRIIDRGRFVHIGGHQLFILRCFRRGLDGGFHRRLRRRFRRCVRGGRSRGLGAAIFPLGGRSRRRIAGSRRIVRLLRRSGFLGLGNRRFCQNLLLLRHFTGEGDREIRRNERDEQRKADQQRQRAKHFLHDFPPLQSADRFFCN